MPLTVFCNRFLFLRKCNIPLHRHGHGHEHGKQVREKIVENFRERMQLRRSLIELEDQNVQNSIEVTAHYFIV